MATARVMQIAAAATDWEDVAELPLYRKHTENLLDRYFRCSIELGRLPAPLGKGLGFLRAKASAYRISSFEETMVFVCDVERCVKRLDAFEQVLVQRIALQDYSMSEAAELLRCARSTVIERYAQSLDRLTVMFLSCGMLKVLG